MSSLADSIISRHPGLAADLDEVEQPTAEFFSQPKTLLRMANVSARWEKVGPSVLSAVRSLADTATGQAACDLLKRITHVAERQEEDEIDRMVRLHKETGLTMTRFAEGSNDSMPSGRHEANDPAMQVQGLHVDIGRVIPELHALVTSCVGPEKQALLMLFNEVHTAHQELGNILAWSNQATEDEFNEAASHFSRIHSEMMLALSPYSKGNPAVASPPYRVSGTSIVDSAS